MKTKKDSYDTLSKHSSRKQTSYDVSESSMSQCAQEDDSNDQDSKTKKHTQLAEKMTSSAFDRQLLQISELEQQINISKLSAEESYENPVESKDYVGSYNAKTDSPSSSLFTENSLADMMASMNSQVLESKNIPIKQGATNQVVKRRVAGSLVTATSLDNNNNFHNATDINEKKVSLDYIDYNQEEENFFAEFDDINFESIERMSLEGRSIIIN